MKTHQVRPGDCLTSIAYENGFFWKTLWDHKDNEGLREARSSPFALIPGEDAVKVPDPRLKEESCATAKIHTFRRRGVPAKLRLRLLHNDSTPRANEAYFLEVDGDLVSTDKKTDGDGRLEEFIKPNAKKARLFLDGGIEIHELSLGHLEPADTVRGVKGRLTGLGFYEGPLDGDLTPALKEAIERFRVEYSLAESMSEEAVYQEIARAHDG